MDRREMSTAFAYRREVQAAFVHVLAFVAPHFAAGKVQVFASPLLVESGPIGGEQHSLPC